MSSTGWHELVIGSYEREDGAAVRYVGLAGTRANGFGWIRLSPEPDREPLAGFGGHDRRFKTAVAAMAAVDRTWPYRGQPG